MQFIAFVSVILRRLLEVFFLVLPFENNLLATVRVTNQVYALCKPSSVDVVIDNDSSSVIRGLKIFFLMKNLSVSVWMVD